MREFFKKFLVLIFIFTLTFSPVCAKEKLKMYGNINHEFCTDVLSDKVSVRLNEENIMPDGTVIPAGSVLTCEIMQVQKERRWHKSGYILSKLKSYQSAGDVEPVDMSDKNI